MHLGMRTITRTSLRSNLCPICHHHFVRIPLTKTTQADNGNATQVFRGHVPLLTKNVVSIPFEKHQTV